MRNIDSLVIHHSVTDKYNKDIWAESVDGRDYHAGYYIDGVEYKGNYHYLIYHDGEIKNPINHDHYTYHSGVYDINVTSLAICFVGDYSTEQPSKEALLSAKKVILTLKERFNIKNIYGHKELFQTRCPGDWWNLNLIMEQDMKLSLEQVRKWYLAILRREPEVGCPYVGAEMSELAMAYELAESREHTQHFDTPKEFEQVVEQLYRKK